MQEKSNNIISHINTYGIFRVGATHRWVYNKGRELTKIMTNLPFEFRIAIPFISQSFKSAAYKQGIGRHTQAEVVDIGIKDLRALSVFLGKNSLISIMEPQDDFKLLIYR